jgi:hypothetical protein
MGETKAVSFLSYYKKVIFICAAIMFFAATCYHSYHFFLLHHKTAILRHRVFTGINLLLKTLFIKRPFFLIPLLFLLPVQPLFSHGSAFANRLYPYQLDWINLVVITMLLFLLHMLLPEYSVRLRIKNSTT